MSVSTRGNKEIALRFEKFPEKAHAKLEARMHSIVDRLQARVEAATPFRTGRLRSEIVGRVYSDQANRIAGYVEVYAPGADKEYPKAATLE